MKKERTTEMPKITASSLVSANVQERFDNACNTVIYGQKIINDNGIGTLSEKTIHAVIKNFIEPDTAFHEIKTGRFVADIRTPDEIFEIQTRQFNRLREKLDSFLPDYNVTVVFPIAHIKYLRWIDPESGEISAPHKSPKKGVMQSVFYELYKIKPYLTHPNFHLRLIMLDLEEYRFLNGWSQDRKKGSSRCDHLPTAIYADELIYSISDYIKLLPDNLPKEFTVKDFMKCAHITQKYAQPAVNVLCHLGIINHISTKGHAYIYNISDTAICY